MNIDKIKNNELHFILSIERTGSTLLSTMLNMHPQILSTIEEPFAFSLYSKYKNVTNWTTKVIHEYCKDFYLFSEGFLEIEFSTQEDFISLLEKYKAVLTWDLVFKLTYYSFIPLKDKSRVTKIVDKQLIFHTFLEEAAQIYPQSKFIILYRDPLDNALVRFRKAKFQKKNFSFSHIALSWNYVFSSLQKKRKKIGTERFLEIKYEDLVTEPEQTLKKVCAFLTLPYEELMLTYHESAQKNMDIKLKGLDSGLKNAIETLHGGLKQKPNTEKIGIGRQNLTTKEAELIWGICGKTAEEAGYKSEGFKSSPNMNLSFCFQSSKYWLTDIFIPRVYHNSPFFIRSLIKKLKYEVLGAGKNRIKPK